MLFYFTYGTDDSMPYRKGWTEVNAPDENTAVTVFRAFHPDRNPGCVNCSSIYSEEEFKKTQMFKEGNFHVFCHESINVTREIFSEEVPDNQTKE